MQLITEDIAQQLLANGRNREADHVPVVKFFDPTGTATWLITEMDEDADTLFGLADLGMGCPELGYVSLRELESVKGPLGLGIERDLYWIAKRTLREYADAAWLHGRIVELD